MNEGRIERVHCLWALAEVKRLREAIEYAIVHAENYDVIRVLDEVMEND